MRYRGGDNQTWGRIETSSPLPKARSYKLSSAIFTLMVAMITFKIQDVSKAPGLFNRSFYGAQDGDNIKA